MVQRHKTVTMEPFRSFAFLISKPLSEIERVRPHLAPRSGLETNAMLNLVVTLLIIALVAAVLGFGGIASAAVGLAKVIFFVVLLLFLVAVLAGSLRAI
jgi:uncharacterized membrane protein YtjA (UPF0391 family)